MMMNCRLENSLYLPFDDNLIHKKKTLIISHQLLLKSKRKCNNFDTQKQQKEIEIYHKSKIC